MEIIPGIVTPELLLGPAAYYGLLLLTSIVAGLLAGKKESDEARAGTGEKSRENLTPVDWAEDAGYGFIGGLIGIAMAPAGVPTLLIPTFGYAGRKLLYNWGKRAEATSEGPIR